MFGFLTSLQRRHKFFRLLSRIFGFTVGIIFAAMGAVGFILIGLTVYKDPWMIFVLAFPVLMALLSLSIGVKAVRDTARSMRNRWLDSVDLDKEPWMAIEGWRNRRIVHRIAVIPALRVLWILVWVVLFGVSVVVAFTVPANILVTAVLISCGMVAALLYLYRYLQEKKVAIKLQEAVWSASALLLGIVGLSRLVPFTSATKRLLEMVSFVLMVFGVASILVYLYLRERKFGISICHLKTLPAFIGGTLEAEIEIGFPKAKTGLPELPEGPVEVELLNFESTGRSQIDHWRAKSTIPALTVMRPGDGTLRIPVAIEIPNEAREKIARGTFWTVTGWKLEIRAPFPGLDYSSWFIVPVYFPESER